FHTFEQPREKRIMHIVRKVKRRLGYLGAAMVMSDEGSIEINDRLVIEAFTANPDNTFFISFPRTGSHWLRMIMELYFERPSLVRVFYYPERDDYLTLHSHDMQLDVERSHVIYLYRDPVDTIYSQLNYCKESLDDLERVSYWSDLYGQHLNKWLFREQFTSQKTVVIYERMKENLDVEFEKITRHFGHSLSATKLAVAAARVSKNEVKRKTRHDPQVVQLQSSYEVKREIFRQKHGKIVWEAVTNGRAHLLKQIGDLYGARAYL
ncbi:MAG: sulfotransferase domain-containing protein, partial [Anaerolineae bacterium]